DLTIRQTAPRQCRDGVDYPAEPGFRFSDLLNGISEGFLRALALNCDERDASGRLHQSKVVRRRHARLGRIDCKGPERVILFGQNRLGPPRPYPILKGKGTM